MVLDEEAESRLAPCRRAGAGEPSPRASVDDICLNAGRSLTGDAIKRALSAHSGDSDESDGAPEDEEKDESVAEREAAYVYEDQSR